MVIVPVQTSSPDVLFALIVYVEALCIPLKEYVPVPPVITILPSGAFTVTSLAGLLLESLIVPETVNVAGAILLQYASVHCNNEIPAVQLNNVESPAQFALSWSWLIADQGLLVEVRVQQHPGKHNPMCTTC